MLCDVAYCVAPVLEDVERSRRARTRIPSELLGVLLFTALGFLVMGYHPGLEDDGVYLAAVKADLNPVFLSSHASIPVISIAEFSSSGVSHSHKCQLQHSKAKLWPEKPTTSRSPSAGSQFPKGGLPLATQEKGISKMLMLQFQSASLRGRGR